MPAMARSTASERDVAARFDASGSSGFFSRRDMAATIQAATPSCTTGANSSDGRLTPQNATREFHALSFQRWHSEPIGVSICTTSPMPGVSSELRPWISSCGTTAKRMANAGAAAAGFLPAGGLGRRRRAS